MKDTKSPIQRTPIENFLNGFPLELAERTLKSDLPVLMAGGDESLYWSMRTSECLPTAVLPQRTPTKPFGRRLMPEIGTVQAETENWGQMTLNEFLARPDSYSQGYLVIHKGDVVFESYPRMHSTDHHIWMSTAKPTAALLVEILIDEGHIDEHAPMSRYIKEFEGTEWDNITVNHTLNMGTGLDIEDTSESRSDPDSHPTRLYRAEFNMPYKGRVERVVDVLATAEKECEPNKKFAYASAHTQALVVLVEAVTGERWSQLFDRKVWSKIGVDGPLQVHTAPDGSALAHGVISSQLSDLARFGMLYTPSWHRIASEQVVTDQALQRIRNGVQTHEFLMNGFDGPVFAKMHGEESNPTFISNSRQWDLLWPDGDMWKGGLMTQGLYVSYDKDLVIVYFSTNNEDHSGHRWARRIANSGLFK